MIIDKIEIIPVRQRTKVTQVFPKAALVLQSLLPENVGLYTRYNLTGVGISVDSAPADLLNNNSQEGGDTIRLYYGTL